MKESTQHDPSHPGAILLELYLEPLKLSVLQAAQKLSIEKTVLFDIINGKSNITQDIAIKLSRAFGTTQKFWINLQSRYDQWHLSNFSTGVKSVKSQSKKYRTYKVLYKNGEVTSLKIESTNGYFVSDFRTASSLNAINTVVIKGLNHKQLKPILKYLKLNKTDLVKITSCTPQFILKWENSSALRLGHAVSYHFFKIDELICKGVKVFGSTANFKKWLDTRNVALNSVPKDLLKTVIGVELVSEAVDALDFGDVI